MTEPTLRDLILAGADAPPMSASHKAVLEAFNTSGAARTLHELSKSLDTTALKIISNSKIHASFASTALTASKVVQHMQTKPIADTYARLFADQKFQSAQRRVVLEMLANRRPPGLPAGIALTAAQALRAAGPITAAANVAQTEARVGQVYLKVLGKPMTAPASETREYGSKQLTAEQTLSLAAFIWTVTQAYLQHGDDKNLLQTHLVTLCLLVAIWCTLAAAP
jgi:hypothetical protein